MQKILVAFFCSVSLCAFSQTKKIAFKSHSGSTEHFGIALENNLFDMENSNFGLPSGWEKKMGMPPYSLIGLELDSVIYVSDSVTVLVAKKSKFATEKPARKDTLRSRPLFFKKNPIDSIKKGLKNEYLFTNPVDSIIFSGFGSKKKQNKRNEIVFSGDINDDNYHPFDGQSFLIIGFIVLLSLLAAFFTWKYQRLGVAHS